MLLSIILFFTSLGLAWFLFKALSKIKSLNSTIQSLKENSTSQDEEFSLGLAKLVREGEGAVLSDSLTGLPGVQAFEDRLSQTIMQSGRFEKSFAILLLTIRDFSSINKKYGHETADKVLIETSKRLQTGVRQIDTVTRYYGDVFVFLLPQLTMPETAAYVAQRLIDTMVQPIKIGEEELTVCVNVGISIFPVDGHDDKSLLNNAKFALNQAKELGKNHYHFFREEMHSLNQREIALTIFVRSDDFLKKLAIQSRPYVNVLNNQVHSIQAMPFYDHPELGFITSLDFLKIADNNKKSFELSQWLLKSAILQYKEWQSSQLHYELVSMNITLKLVNDPEFIQFVSSTLTEYSMSPNHLMFEISDENLLNQHHQIENSFLILRQLGVKIAISVFSLGQLSLQKIGKLPIDFLKIDTKLLKKGGDNENTSIIHMIISLSKEMGIQILADGVDTLKDKELLKQLGCEIMQGKLFEESLIV